MSQKGSILFPVKERPEPNSRSYYGEDVTKDGDKRRVFGHTKLFRINSNISTRSEEVKNHRKLDYTLTE